MSNKYNAYIQLSAQEQTEQRESAYKSKLRLEQRNGMQQMIYMGILLLLSGIAFIFHWKFAKRVETKVSAV